MPIESQKNPVLHHNRNRRETFLSFVLKIMYCIIQIIFFTFGITLVGLYFWLNHLESSSTELLSEATYQVYKSILMVGLIFIAMTVFAMYAVMRNHKILTMLYIALLLLILAVEIIIFVRIPGVIDHAEEEIRNIWDNLGEEALKTIQERLKCCGYNDPSEGENCPDGATNGCATLLLSWMDSFKNNRVLAFALLFALDGILLVSAFGLVYLHN